MLRNHVQSKFFKKLDKESQGEVIIRELLIAYCFSYSFGESQSVKNGYSNHVPLLERLIAHTSLIINIANQYHQDHYFNEEKDGSFTIKSDAKNTITRISLNEFALYTKDAPLTLDEFNKLLIAIEEIAGKCHANLHVLLSTLAVKGPNNEVLNMAVYIQCGHLPKVTPFAKAIPSPSDVTYPDLMNFTSNNVDQRDEAVYMVLPADSTGVAIPYGSLIDAETIGGVRFLVSIDICVDHEKGHALKMFKKKLELTSGSINAPSIPYLINHMVTSNFIEADPLKIIGQNTWITHIDPFSYGVFTKNQLIKKSSKMFPKCDELDEKSYSSLINKDFTSTTLSIEQDHISVKNPPFGKDYRIIIFPEIKLSKDNLGQELFKKIDDLNKSPLQSF